jgi:hypothetical protein
MWNYNGVHSLHYTYTSYNLQDRWSYIMDITTAYNNGLHCVQACTNGDN